MTQIHERCGGKLVWHYDVEEWSCEKCGLTPDPQPAPPEPSDYMAALNRDDEVPEHAPPGGGSWDERLPGSTADYLGES